MKAPTDIEVDIVSIAANEFSQDGGEVTKVLQAEFNVLNTNYLSVLFRKGNRNEQHRCYFFKVYDLEEGKCELDFNLNDMVPEHHLYGSFN